MVRVQPPILGLSGSRTAAPCALPLLCCAFLCVKGSGEPVWAQVKVPDPRSLLFPQPIRKGQRDVYAGLEPRGF